MNDRICILGTHRSAEGNQAQCRSHGAQQTNCQINALANRALMDGWKLTTGIASPPQSGIDSVNSL
jgi:hypothetical protein